MNNNRVEEIIVLDRSGSMSSCQKDMEGGLNSYIDKQKEEASKNGYDIYVTFVIFDDKIETVFQAIPIKAVGTLSLNPRGFTSLNDAIGTTLIKEGNRLASMEEKNRPCLVKVFIITDGEENSSKEFTSEKINSMINEQQSKYNWQFTYLGANQDAFHVGKKLGIKASSVSNYNTDKVLCAFSALSDKSSRTYEAMKFDGIATDDGFTEKERQSML